MKPLVPLQTKPLCLFEYANETIVVCDMFLFKLKETLLSFQLYCQIRSSEIKPVCVRVSCSLESNHSLIRLRCVFIWQNDHLYRNDEDKQHRNTVSVYKYSKTNKLTQTNKKIGKNGYEI